MTIYELHRVQDTQNNNIRNLAEAIKGRIVPESGKTGYSLYGTFFGLFGLASNELYLMTTRAESGPSAENITPLSKLITDHNFSIRENYQLSPTIRPIEHTERTRKGIYVFRWFLIHNSDVDEIVRLSDEAWVSFEDDFDSQVQGLFAERDRRPERGRMLLLTWYRNLSVWETSRHPSSEARERFQKRHRMTTQTIAIATRLYQAQ